MNVNTWKSLPCPADSQQAPPVTWHATCKRCKGFVPGEALLSGDAVRYVAPATCPRCDETDWKR